MKKYAAYGDGEKFEMLELPDGRPVNAEGLEYYLASDVDALLSRDRGEGTADGWPCGCLTCGWTGDSLKAAGGNPIADTGDFSDPACPECVKNDGPWIPVVDLEAFFRERRAPVDHEAGLPEGCPETAHWSKQWGFCWNHEPSEEESPVEIHPVGTRAALAGRIVETGTAKKEGEE